MASWNASPRATSPTAAGTAGWRPLLVGDSRQRALALVDQVLERTAPGTLEGADVSLHHGSTGLALCLLAATSDIDPGRDRAFAMSPLVSW